MVSENIMKMSLYEIACLCLENKEKKEIPCALQGVTVDWRLFPEVSHFKVSAIGCGIRTMKITLTRHSQQVIPS